uniref:CSON003687 protein n=1 Tax=Culicoides sonorensis TaxID=179676 RepID=A0A336LIF2_CULSO
MEKLKKILSSTIKQSTSFIVPSINLSESDTSESESSEDMAPGHFESYSEGTPVEEYLERFEAYLILHNVTNELQRTVHFIGTCGSYLYSRVKSSCNPRAPMEVPFNELKTLLTGILCPKNVVSIERAKFHLRNQSEGESVTNYIQALRKLAQTCDFGAQLESQLKDRFVVGIRDPSMRSQVIDTLSLEEAVSKASTLELSKRLPCSSMADMSLNVFQPRRRGPNKDRRFNTYQKKCSNCNRFCRGDCPAKNYQCYRCKRKGHVAACCKANLNQCYEDSSTDTLGSVRLLSSGRQVGSNQDCINLHPSTSDDEALDQ